MMKKNIRIGIAGAVLIVLMIAAGVFYRTENETGRACLSDGRYASGKNSACLSGMMSLGQARFAIPLHVLQTRVMMRPDAVRSLS